MTDPDRPPRSPDRAEGDPPGEDAQTGRTPSPDDPAEGGDVGGGAADTPG